MKSMKKCNTFTASVSRLISQILIIPSSEKVASWFGWNGSNITPLTALEWAITLFGDKKAAKLLNYVNKK